MVTEERIRESEEDTFVFFNQILDLSQENPEAYKELTEKTIETNGRIQYHLEMATVADSKEVFVDHINHIREIDETMKAEFTKYDIFMNKLTIDEALESGYNSLIKLLPKAIEFGIITSPR